MVASCTLKAEGKPYPRTCAVCGFGPCQNAAPRRIIGFCGLIGSGKTSAALHLVNAHNWRRLRFADPLKAALRALGCTDTEIDGDRKEVPSGLLCGHTPRHAMQTLGTEWGRDMIGPDFWENAWCVALARVPAGISVVVDDVRFPSEARIIRNLSGLLVRVERPEVTATDHISEQFTLPVDVVVNNNGSLVELFTSVDTLLRTDGPITQQRAS